MATHPTIELIKLTKKFGEVVAVDSIALEVEVGELVSLLGPSGCGKTTTLNMVAGFLEPDAGDIRLDGQSVAGRPPNKRNCGMVFQSYALFPHMSVFENVAFGLRVRNIAKTEIAERVHEALAMTRLQGLHNRSPQQLSGGQRQRVSIARALVYRPDVLLLDEPFSNLDAKLRVAMRAELVEIQRKARVTALFVTHDQEEAMHISDRIVVMNAGRIEQIGTPNDVYRRPDSVFVADFLGDANLIEGQIVESTPGLTRFEMKGGLQFTAATGKTGSKGDACWLMIRPEHIFEVLDGAPAPENILQGTVKSHAFLGSSHIAKLEMDGQEWSLKVPDSAWTGIAQGDTLRVGWSATDCVILDA